jgi:hypothetical protein
MLKNFTTWLNEQAPVDPAAMADPTAAGAAPAAPASPTATEKIRAILISKPIGSVDKPGDMVTKQFNEYVLDMGRVKEWIEKNEKDAEQEILDYLGGKDVDLKDSHKKFATAVQNNELGKPQTVIDIDFTKDGEPTTKDISLIFLA